MKKIMLFAIMALVLLTLLTIAIAGCMKTYGPGGRGSAIPDQIAYTKEYINNYSFLAAIDPTRSFFNDTSKLEKKFLLVETTYHVPVDSMLTISNPTQFSNWCTDGSHYNANPVMRVIVVNPLQEKIIYTNSSCSGTRHCSGGTVCVGVGFDGTQAAPFPVVEFTRTGTHSVKVYFSPISSSNIPETSWRLNEEFLVNVINPLLAITKADNKILSFHDETEKKENLIWSIKNITETEILVNDVTTTGCDTNIMTCKLKLFTTGQKILPGEAIKIFEEITVKNPKDKAIALPITKELGLQVKYTDANLIATKEKSSPTTSVTVTFEETQKFRVKLFAKEQEDCIGPNDELGQTGSGNKPKVLFSWEWKNIAKDACDKKTNDNYIYCDSTQFTIELLKKLNQVDQILYEKGTIVDNDIYSLTNFKAYLIGDNYNDDFRKDFDYYYTKVGFANADLFYSQKGFDKYINNTQPFLKFESEGGTIVESGLYGVIIDINSTTGTGTSMSSLFENSAPSAQIKVNLKKISDPAIRNPLYYLPFNGDVGKGRVDEDGVEARKGYGIAFSGDKIKINNSENNQTDSTTGQIKLTTIQQKSFEKTNIQNRGVLLKITKDKIEFAPTNPTPVLAKITAKDMRAEVYYSIKKTGETLNATDNLTYWTGISSPDCKDFLGNALFYRKQDARADETNCTLKNKRQQESYGFEWAGTPKQKDNSSLYMQTIFFTPIGQSFSLENSCPETPTQFYGPNTTTPTKTISLSHAPGNFESMQETLDLISERKACISVLNGEMKLWWNNEEIIKALDNVKKTMPINNCTQKT